MKTVRNGRRTRNESPSEFLHFEIRAWVKRGGHKCPLLTPMSSSGISGETRLSGQEWMRRNHQLISQELFSSPSPIRFIGVNKCLLVWKHPLGTLSLEVTVTRAWLNDSVNLAFHRVNVCYRKGAEFYCPCPTTSSACLYLWKNFRKRINLFREMRTCRNKGKQAKETKW